MKHSSSAYFFFFTPLLNLAYASGIFNPDIYCLNDGMKVTHHVYPRRLDSSEVTSSIAGCNLTIVASNTECSNPMDPFTGTDYLGCGLSLTFTNNTDNSTDFTCLSRSLSSKCPPDNSLIGMILGFSAAILVGSLLIYLKCRDRSSDNKSGCCKPLFRSHTPLQQIEDDSNIETLQTPLLNP